MKAVLGLCVIMPVFIVGLLSCSIKPERSDCPCRLSIEMGTPLPQMSLNLFRDGSSVYSQTVRAADFSSGQYVADIVRGRYVFSLSCGSAVVPEGFQCDSVYSWSSCELLDANCEELTINPVMHKQFVTLYIELEYDSGMDVYADLIVFGDVCGIDFQEQNPVRGVFCCKPSMMSGNEFSVRVPRQIPGDNTLRIDLLNDGVTVAALPVGEFIASTGFDWTEPDLSDIYLNVNCTETGFGISVQNWEVGFVKEERI